MYVIKNVSVQYRNKTPKSKAECLHLTLNHWINIIYCPISHADAEHLKRLFLNSFDSI